MDINRVLSRTFERDLMATESLTDGDRQNCLTLLCICLLWGNKTRQTGLAHGCSLRVINYWNVHGSVGVCTIIFGRANTSKF